MCVLLIHFPCIDDTMLHVIFSLHSGIIFYMLSCGLQFLLNYILWTFSNAVNSLLPQALWWLCSISPSAWIIIYPVIPCSTIRCFPAIVYFCFVLSAMISCAAVSISVQCSGHSWSAFLTPLSHRYIGPSTVFGSSGKLANVEQWRCVSILRSHSGGEWGCLLGWAAPAALGPFRTILVLKEAPCVGRPSPSPLVTPCLSLKVCAVTIPPAAFSVPTPALMGYMFISLM